MQLPLSRAVAPHLELVPEAGSTNAELAGRASVLPHFAALATTNQTAGKGRLGRVWIAPPGKTIAVSVLLKPGAVPLQALGWLPLLAGVAMTEAVRALVPGHEVTLKWPNDVHVDGRKVSGLLSEYVPAAQAVVVGAGLNLTVSADELPTATSTSLTLNGTPESGIVDVALSGYLRALEQHYRQFAAAGFDAEPALRAVVTRECSSLGRSVRVELPAASDLYGVAESIDERGRLVVRDTAGIRHRVSAGDVTHLRYE